MTGSEFLEQKKKKFRRTYNRKEVYVIVEEARRLLYSCYKGAPASEANFVLVRLRILMSRTVHVLSCSLSFATSFGHTKQRLDNCAGGTNLLQFSQI